MSIFTVKCNKNWHYKPDFARESAVPDNSAPHCKDFVMRFIKCNPGGLTYNKPDEMPKEKL